MAASNIPCSEFESGQESDINAILYKVEDFIKKNCKTSDKALSETQSQLPGVLCCGNCAFVVWVRW